MIRNAWGKVLGKHGDPWLQHNITPFVAIKEIQPIFVIGQKASRQIQCRWSRHGKSIFVAEQLTHAW
jgi:hypothetical protein